MQAPLKATHVTDIEANESRAFNGASRAIDKYLGSSGSGTCVRRSHGAIHYPLATQLLVNVSLFVTVIMFLKDRFPALK
jgi:hypothetical protein